MISHANERVCEYFALLYYCCIADAAQEGYTLLRYYDILHVFAAHPRCSLPRQFLGTFLRRDCIFLEKKIYIERFGTANVKKTKTCLVLLILILIVIDLRTLDIM